MAYRSNYGSSAGPGFVRRSPVTPRYEVVPPRMEVREGGSSDPEEFAAQPEQAASRGVSGARPGIRGLFEAADDVAEQVRALYQRFRPRALGVRPDEEGVAGFNGEGYIAQRRTAGG